MSNAVTGVNPYMSRAVNTQVAAASGAGRVWRAQKAAMPGVPVQPVNPVTAVVDAGSKPEPVGLGLPQGAAADLAEMSVRGNMQPFQGEQILATSVGGAWLGERAGSTEIPGQLLSLANEDAEILPWLPGNNPDAESEAARLRILGSGEEKTAGLEGDEAVDETEEDEDSQLNGAQEEAEEGKCETCEKRKYQDGSDDAGVSFKTPTRIDPSQVASAVRGHEMEHVFREQAKAKREGRKVVSQTVTLHTAICPECGKVYISGGTTRTATMADNSSKQNTSDAGNNAA